MFFRVRRQCIANPFKTHALPSFSQGYSNQISHEMEKTKSAQIALLFVRVTVHTNRTSEHAYRRVFAFVRFGVRFWYTLQPNKANNFASVRVRSFRLVLRIWLDTLPGRYVLPLRVQSSGLTGYARHRLSFPAPQTIQAALYLPGRIRSLS